MPKTRKASEKGNLYVKFEIEFPEDNWIDQDQIKVSQSVRKFKIFYPLCLDVTRFASVPG